MKNSRFQILVKEGQKLPPFWYGSSWWDWPRDVMVFHPYPFNYLLRFLRWLRQKWRKVQVRNVQADEQRECRIFRSREQEYQALIAKAYEELQYWRRQHEEQCQYTIELLRGYEEMKRRIVSSRN